MSLKHRNAIAWILLVIFALCWTAGRFLLHEKQAPDIYETAFGWNEWENEQPTSEQEPTPMGTDVLPHGETTPQGIRVVGMILCFGAIVAAGVSIIWLRCKAPVIGPDGTMWMFILISILKRAYLRDYLDYTIVTDFLVYSLVDFLLVAGIRELWGWIQAGFPLSWCTLARTASRCAKPQTELLLLCSGIAGLTSGVLFAGVQQNWIITILLFVSDGLGVLCLWNYGSSVQHFKTQLDHFQKSAPVEIKAGPFETVEAQLLQVQEQHREAVKTAVASERFKVDLIANVSHDLRTPLTAILGYGELLQKETLSQEGEKQLSRLNQKAGYMRELVDSLFELTKVSSGVLESKQEKIDLIRLLEQTIGLFDDQLSIAGLVVRRHYESESAPLVTDGGRMHQVFANLLGNAIKYALPGTRIHLEVKENKEAYVVRMVNTSSYEMDFEPNEIMQRFARGDKARSTKGSGLGLAIAQTYTESVGGRFRVAVDGDQFSAIVTLPKSERNL